MSDGANWRHQVEAPLGGEAVGGWAGGAGGCSHSEQDNKARCLFAVAPRDKSYLFDGELKKKNPGALKVKQTGGKQRRVKGTKDSAQLVAFSLSRGRPAIVTSGRGSWIATVVTLRLVNGLRLKGFELNVGAQASSY